MAIPEIVTHTAAVMGTDRFFARANPGRFS
jgi:hypothetical protein